MKDLVGGAVFFWDGLPTLGRGGRFFSMLIGHLDDFPSEHASRHKIFPSEKAYSEIRHNVS